MNQAQAPLFESNEPAPPPASKCTGVLAEFFVPGTPATQGSKRAFMPKGWKRPVIVEDCKMNKDWKGDVKHFALEAVAGKQWDSIARSPMRLEVIFFMPRPKGHTGKRGLLPSAPRRPVTIPDLTKMLRAVEDSLKGVLWGDDSQVVEQAISKFYADDHQPGAQVTVAFVEG